MVAVLVGGRGCPDVIASFSFPFPQLRFPSAALSSRKTLRAPPQHAAPCPADWLQDRHDHFQYVLEVRSLLS